MKRKGKLFLRSGYLYIRFFGQGTPTIRKSGGFVNFCEALFIFISQVFSYVLNNTIELFLSNYMFAGLGPRFCWVLGCWFGLVFGVFFPSRIKMAFFYYNFVPFG